MDRLTRAERSALMSKIKSEWTGPERRLYQAMQDVGLDPRTHDKQLPGRPDFVFDDPPACPDESHAPHAPWRPLAVMVEGCFFHGCKAHYKRPKTNRKFWDKKVRDNMARDRRSRRALNAMGIRVMRVWEHDVRVEKAAHSKAQAVWRRLCQK